MSLPALPSPGHDRGAWATKLNAYLEALADQSSPEALSATIAADVNAKSPATGFVMEAATETAATGTTILPVGSIDGVIYGRHATTGGLYSSTNGTSWTLITNAVTPYGGIHKLGNGEVLVNGTGNLSRSTGWAANPATATWTTCLTANGTSSFIDSDVATYGNLVLAAEYAVPRTDARYVKLSQDNGQTWMTVRDLNTLYPGDEANTHWHAVAIDHFHSTTTPRLWVSHGDGPRGVFYSDNLGSSWTEYGPANTWQPMPMMATEAGIVTSTDQNNPDGVWLIPRDLSARVLLANIPAPFWNDSLLGFGTTARRDETTGIVYILFRADQQAHFTEARSAIIFATDGYRADLIYETAQKGTVGVTGSVSWNGQPAFTSDGYLLATYTDNGSTKRVVRGRIRRGSKTARRRDPGNVLTGGAADRYSVGIGYGTAPAARSVHIGSLAKATTPETDGSQVLIGEESTGGHRATGVGFQTTQTTLSVAVGYTAKAGDESVTVGSQATMTTGKVRCVIIGASASSTESNATAVGRSASVTGASGTAVGHQALASGQGSVAIGAGGTVASAFGAVAIGDYQTSATGSSSTALGSAADATQTRATALGAGAQALHQDGIAIGNATTTATLQVAIGAKHVELTELAADPSAPAANNARWYTKDNGAGKTQLCVRFATGAVQVIATEP